MRPYAEYEINERKFKEIPYFNGARELIAVDGGVISEEEWETYCSLITSQSITRHDAERLVEVFP